MPDIIKKPNGDIDWNKFFMGLAAAILFLYQGLHQIQLNNLNANLVPRAEYNKDIDTVLHKNIIYKEFDKINSRLDKLEVQHD